MAQFDRAIATALRLVQKNGQQVIWRKVAENAPDPAKPWLAVGTTTTDYAQYICFLPFDSAEKESLAAIAGSEAVSGSYYGLMGNVPFEPSLRDVVIRNGVTLDILSIDLLSPNGQKVLYTITFNG